MTDTHRPTSGRLPHHRQILEGTDWASLGTGRGTGESLPAALTRLLDADPTVREAAARDTLEEVTHQNSLFDAAVPVALYAAAVLGHPAITAGDFGQDMGTQPRRPTLVILLNWLGDTAYDADDEQVALGESRFGESYLREYGALGAFRDARPALFSAVRPLLGHDDTGVREAAVVAALPLAEHPALTAHHGELADHARRLLATSTDRYYRDRVLDAFRAWGHDTRELENASDIGARERRARLAAARWGGGCSDDPWF